MKCPLCHNEMRIDKTILVKKDDGTYANKMYLKCRSKDCVNFDKVTQTIYEPVKVIADDGI